MPPNKMNRAQLEERRRAKTPTPEEEEQQKDAFAAGAIPPAFSRPAPPARPQLYPMQMRFTAAMIVEIEQLMALEYPNEALRPSRHAWILEAVVNKIERKRAELVKP